jgi:anti-sigma regulatory factor (Ser/Thr protein kinase)
MTPLHTAAGASSTADPPGRLRCELPVTPRAASTARALLGRFLGDHLAPDACGDAGLVLTELVANAVTASPACGAIRIEVRLTAGELLLEVFDGSRATPHHRAADDLAEGGRGLLLVEALSSHWGWRPAPGGGKVVWAAVRTDLVALG